MLIVMAWQSDYPYVPPPAYPGFLDCLGRLDLDKTRDIVYHRNAKELFPRLKGELQVQQAHAWAVGRGWAGRTRQLRREEGCVLNNVINYSNLASAEECTKKV